MKVATDLDYATQRLNMLKERYNKRQEVLGALPPLQSLAWMWRRHSRCLLPGWASNWCPLLAVLRAGQVQQQEVAHAQQAAQRVAAALGKDAAPRQQQGEGQQQQQQLAAGPSWSLPPGQQTCYFSHRQLVTAVACKWFTSRGEECWG